MLISNMKIEAETVEITYQTTTALQPRRPQPTKLCYFVVVSIQQILNSSCTVQSPTDNRAFFEWKSTFRLSESIPQHVKAPLHCSVIIKLQFIDAYVHVRETRCIKCTLTLWILCFRPYLLPVLLLSSLVPLLRSVSCIIRHPSSVGEW